MNSTETMLKMCLGKKAYHSLGYAEKKGAELKMLRGVDLRVYWCPVCGHYHLTSQRLEVRSQRSEENADAAIPR